VHAGMRGGGCTSIHSDSRAQVTQTAQPRVQRARASIYGHTRAQKARASLLKLPEALTPRVQRARASIYRGTSRVVIFVGRTALINAVSQISLVAGLDDLHSGRAFEAHGLLYHSDEGSWTF